MRIDNPSPAWAALQSDLVRRMQDMRRAASVGRTAATAPVAQRPATANERALQRIQVQLAQLPANAPDSASRVFRLFLESVLVEQFGDAAALSPAFFAMIDEVQRQMEANATLARKIRVLADSILKPTART